MVSRNPAPMAVTAPRKLAASFRRLRVAGAAPAGAEILALANQKGGVAKTTSTINLGAALQEQGLKVLVVDLDPQSNLTMSLGIDPEHVERSMFDVLVHRMPIEEIIHHGELDVAVSSHRPGGRGAGAVVHDRPRARAREGADADRRTTTTSCSSTRRRRSGC